MTQAPKKKCCDDVKKKCFKYQLEALSNAHEARRREMSRSLMDTLVADEIAEEEREYARDMGIDY